MQTFKLKPSIHHLSLLLSLALLNVVLTTPLFAAVSFEASTVPFNHIAPYAVSNSDVGTGNANAYRPWLENGTWQGDLIEYDISNTGKISTTVDASPQPPIQDAETDGHNWSARLQFDAAVTAASTYWSTVRKVIFHNGSIQKAFLYDNLSADQKTALPSDKLDYIRGDRSKETDQTNGTFRKRFNILGDIVHSNPIYIGAPDATFTGLPGYSTFKNTTYANRAARVYVGANDGMLHAFNATTGNEEWAYVPSMLITNLNKLTTWPSSHEYMVDGQLAEGDMDFDNDRSTYSWKSILAGGLGSGGKGFYILDVTNPSVTAQTSTSSVDQKILYEFDGSDVDMGYIYGKAQVARLTEAHADEWVVITGNGYGSTDGKAKLLMIDKDGNTTKVATNNTTGNGLSAPVLVDIGNDFDVDVAYAGDLKGNLWKFDLSTSPATSSLLYPTVEDANADKPITSAPDVRVHPNGGYLVYFGTGSLLSSSDKADTAGQSIFGIWDGAPAGNTIIVTQTLITGTHTYTDTVVTDDNPDGTNVVTRTIRTMDSDDVNVIDWSINKGWQVDLNISGERVVASPTVRANRLQIVTHNPLSGEHGDAWYLQLNYLNGGTGASVFLDLNQDGSLNASDKVSDNIPLGINLGNGSFSKQTIVRVTNSRDTTLINGLFLEFTDGCTANCTNGFQGGHVDVETDDPQAAATADTTSDSYCYDNGNRAAGIPVDSSGDGVASPFTNAAIRTGGDFSAYNDYDSRDDGTHDGYGGEVDGHIHEYDKLHGQVYVDAVNLEPLCEQSKAVGSGDNGRQDLARITEVITDYSKKFFVIMANADLSSGSTFHLGAKSWNGLVYQKMMQKNIKAWKLAGANTSLDTGVTNSFASMMVDDDGDTLLFSLTSMLAAGSNTGTFRHSFNDRALADGGLMGNIPECVGRDPEENISKDINDSYPTVDTGRWRGGSLVTQAIAVTEYLTDITTVIEQEPTDLTPDDVKFKTIDDVEVYLVADELDATGAAGTDTTDEIYGGLRARHRVGGVPAGAITNNPAFLYELDLFWHYAGNSRSTDYCYGQTGYAAKFAQVIGSFSTESLLAELAAKRIELAEAQVELDDCTQWCWWKQYTVTSLTEEIAELESGLSNENVINTGTPGQTGDINSNISPALGPNFKTGRRTWIDL